MSSRRRRWGALRRVARRFPPAVRAYHRYLRWQRDKNRKSLIVYVDGFNLYANQLKYHPETKWLDLYKLCCRLFPGFEVKLVRYFTAEIRALKGKDPRGPSRQSAYLRAVALNPKVKVHLGRFGQAKRYMDRYPIVLRDDGTPETVRVRKLEEKQSDVNLGAWMVHDALKNSADAYVLVSNDSDFAGLLEMMTRELKRPIGLVSPIDSLTGELMTAGPRYVRKIRLGLLSDCQLPETLHDDVGTITRPDLWSASAVGKGRKSRGPVSGAPQPVAEASGDVNPVSQS